MEWCPEHGIEPSHHWFTFHEPTFTHKSKTLPTISSPHFCVLIRVLNQMLVRFLRVFQLLEPNLVPSNSSYLCLTLPLLPGHFYTLKSLNLRKLEPSRRIELLLISRWFTKPLLSQLANSALSQVNRSQPGLADSGSVAYALMKSRTLHCYYTPNFFD